jgi:DNA-binding beta-propeller fold protein YncE
MVYTRNGGANSELRFARWFSLPSIEEERGNFSSAAGVELVAKEGSYYGYVTDKLTGTVTKIDALFKQATPEVVLSGLDHPRDIVKNNERFYIACKDGIKLYDDKFNYLYTFELKHPTTGQIYSPSLIALSPEGNKMYVISEESDNLFIFE